MTRPLATSASETAARYHVTRERTRRTHPPLTTAPAYATDGIAIPRRKRRVLLDLAPVSVDALLLAVRHEIHAEASQTMLAMERVLVEALEKAR